MRNCTIGTISVHRASRCCERVNSNKAILGVPQELLEKTGYLADRVSVNLELPISESLRRLAPQFVPAQPVRVRR